MDIRVVGFFIGFIILIIGFCFGSILLNVGNNIFYILLNVSTLLPLGVFLFIYMGDSFPDRKMSVAIGSFILFFLIPIVSASILTDEDNQKISVEKAEMIKKYIAQKITTDDEKVYLNSLFSHSDDPYVAQRVGGLVCIKSINSSLCKLWLDAVARDVKNNVASINKKTYGDVEAKIKQRESEQEELKKFEQENLK
jgi:hypothetical protein